MIEVFNKLKHSPLHNYILPGLTSWMLKAATESEGAVRMFEATRTTEEFIAPHSHRYGLQCEVLQGWVENTIWKQIETFGASSENDPWMLCDLKYGGEPGKYDLEHRAEGFYRPYTDRYQKGQTYRMDYTALHTIKFSRGAVVVITETEQMTDTNRILLPVAYGKVVPTFKVEPWMYKP